MIQEVENIQTTNLQEVEVEPKKTKKIVKKVIQEIKEVDDLIQDILNIDEEDFKIYDEEEENDYEKENEDEEENEDNEEESELEDKEEESELKDEEDKKKVDDKLSLLDNFKEKFTPLSFTTPRGYSYTTQLKSLSELEYNRMEDLLKGEIYLVFNKKNGKMYIGKANCFTGRNNDSWGTIGRWKSHVNETINATQDHCRVLNNAIRKYGVVMLEVFSLVRVFMDELDFVEKLLISHHRSMVPHGYNLRTGGNDGKDSIETKVLKSESKTKRKSPTKVYQPGPISKDILKLSKDQAIFQQKVDRKIYILEKRKLPENIDPIVNSGKIVGYKVKGLTDAEGNPYPSRNFVDKTNKWNLDRAIKFIEQIEYYNQYNIQIKDVEKMHIQDRTKSMEDGYYLPEYLQIHRYYGEVKGFKINGFPHSEYKDGKLKKIFAAPKKTKDENYKDAIEYLEKLHNGEIEIKKRDSTKATYNGKELPQFVTVVFKDRETKDEIQGFRINGMPVNGKKVYSSYTFGRYDNLDEMYQLVMQEYEELKKQIKE